MTVVYSSALQTSAVIEVFLLNTVSQC